MLRNRIIWTILLIVALIGISFFGGPITYGFLAVIIMVPIISLVYLMCVYLCFRIYQSKDVNRPMVGESVPFHFRLMDEFFFAFSGIRIKFFTSFSTLDGLDDEAEYELVPGKGINMDTRLVCKYRGNYEVGIKAVEIQDFFRLFRFQYNNSETMRIDVIPRIIMLDSIKCLDQISVQRETRSQNAMPDVLVREYVPGDDIRQMNWKASSHVGKLMIRKQIDEEKQGIGIIVDTSRQSDDIKDYLPVENKMLETAIAIAYYFASKQTSVVSFVGSSEPVCLHVNRLEAFDDYYEAMAAVNFINLNSDAGHKRHNTKRNETIKHGEDLPNVYDALTSEGYLYGCKMVFVIAQKQSDSMTGLCELLTSNNIFVQRLLVNNEDDENMVYINNNRENLIHINMESDLMEVL